MAVSKSSQSIRSSSTNAILNQTDFIQSQGIVPSSTHKVELPGAAHLLNTAQMPHRVDSYPPMSTSYVDPLFHAHYKADRRRRHGREHGAHRFYQPHHSSSHGHAPSPPPIATLSHSPSLSTSSLEHSANSSPHPSRRPLPMPRSSLDSTYTEPYYAQDHGHHAPHRHLSAPYPHSSPRSSHTYPYPPRPTQQYRYDSGDSLSSGYPASSSYSNATVPSMGPGSMPPMRDNSMYGAPPQHFVPVVHTDDATTKLSDRIRRRCFNCCTTDTSTWRRSNLSPGKVVSAQWLSSIMIGSNSKTLSISSVTNAGYLNGLILVQGQINSLIDGVQ